MASSWRRRSAATRDGRDPGLGDHARRTSRRRRKGASSTATSRACSRAVTMRWPRSAAGSRPGARRPGERRSPSAGDAPGQPAAATASARRPARGARVTSAHAAGPFSSRSRTSRGMPRSSRRSWGGRATGCTSPAASARRASPGGRDARPRAPRPAPARRRWARPHPEIRGSERLGDVPILLVSASVLPRDVQAAMEAGCDGFLPKPVRVKPLVDEVGAACWTSGAVAPETGRLAAACGARPHAGRGVAAWVGWAGGEPKGL